jgi:hypothetical protein
MGHPKYLIVYGDGSPGPDGCPCPYEVAAQVHMMLRQMRRAASSIYRGEDAAGLLHAHGKHTQAEIHRMYPDISNPPGFSQHDLHSDGVANTQPRGAVIPAWSVGIDAGDDTQHERDVAHAAGRHYRWYVKTPYSRGVEAHHWCFGSPPRARTPWQAARIAYWRRRLPRR